MQPDPMIPILFTAAVCFILGFFASAVICARRIRQAESEGWRAGVRFYQDREIEARQPRL